MNLNVVIFLTQYVQHESFQYVINVKLGKDKDTYHYICTKPLKFDMRFTLLTHLNLGQSHFTCCVGTHGYGSPHQPAQPSQGHILLFPESPHFRQVFANILDWEMLEEQETKNLFLLEARPSFLLSNPCLYFSQWKQNRCFYG